MNFHENIALSFRKVKKDFEAIKQSVTDWIFSINRRQGYLERKIVELEARLRQLEKSNLKDSFGGQNGRVF